ncbi:hypothetical protein [Roseofilum casamattae]|uniref:Acetyltransferase n=1 Tax=Roseofilum casamattae BLCC-M143 TaxID=3022442 RepID=A0ABT7BSJ4_9CYAN|nr:hypothetical protein [Roseofilum casamattae]MDJ1182161.1 acetyltransferase [Roseofilum casamattae BLCC-M143]
MSESSSTPASAEEIQEVIGELEAYRDRLTENALESARKTKKISKKQALDDLENHPEMIKIKQALQALQGQQG